tara:strand:- start:84 stop:302 length:219 start_codon:yes stop_codon:yes gene_type:complete
MYPKLIICGTKNLSKSCKKNNITIGEKSIPDIGGSTLLTKLYKGSHNSSINENIGWFTKTLNQLLIAEIIIR